MKKALTIAMIFLIMPVVHADQLFSASSKDRGIEQFDYKVTETSRNNTHSILSIPNFQQRSAKASRWMMCIYTELAIERGFEYWSSIYNNNSDDTVILVFPSRNSQSDAAFKELDLLGEQPSISRISTFKTFCGIN